MDQTSNKKLSHPGLYFLELLGIFAVLYAFGAWPVPDVNEAYYLGKAIHFWNPSWCPGDTFLESKDAHWFFFAAFGWLSLFLTPTLFAWSGRIIIWAFFAWSWRRLSWAFIPYPFFSLLSVAGLLHYLNVFQMSGEWIIGGVEGKGFAFPFFLLGLEALVRNQWKRVWPFFGASASFHVLIGGWAVLIGMFVWLFQNRTTRTSLRSMLPFLVLGGLLSLPGLIPALFLNYGTPRDIVSQAHWIYVFERLGHHLVPFAFPWTFRFRFLVFVLLWATLSLFCFYCFRKFNDRLETTLTCDSVSLFELRNRFTLLNWFVGGTLLLTGIGFVIAWTFANRPFFAANLLRFYWFRMSDVAVPLAFSLFATRLLYQTLFCQTFFYQILVRKAETIECSTEWSIGPTGAIGQLLRTVLVILLVGVGVFLLLDWLIFGLLFFTWFPPPDPSIPWGLTMTLGFIALFVLLKRQKVRTANLLQLFLFLTLVIWGPLQETLRLAETRTRFAYARNEAGSPRNAFLWDDVCNWIKDPANEIPQQARFLTPRETTSFKWKTNRPEVANWKEIPQDAAGIVKWYNTVEELFTYRPEDEPVRRDFPLASMLERYNPEQFQELREKYQFDYVLCNKYPALNLPVLYENLGYVVYDARK